MSVPKCNDGDLPQLILLGKCKYTTDETVCDGSYTIYYEKFDGESCIDGESCYARCSWSESSSSCVEKKHAVDTVCGLMSKSECKGVVLVGEGPYNCVWNDDTEFCDAEKCQASPTVVTSSS